MKSKTTYAVTLCAATAAIISLTSQIQIPLPSGVPLTLQTFAVALCGYVAALPYSVISIAVYILLGCVGLPVFSGFSGGVGKLLGGSGGFIFGFVFLALMCGIKFKSNKKSIRIFFGFAGVLLCHICGILHFAIITQTNFFAAAALVSLPFLLKDFLSVILAFMLSEKINKIGIFKR